MIRYIIYLLIYLFICCIYLFIDLYIYIYVCMYVCIHTYKYYSIRSSLAGSPYKLGPRKISGNLWQCLGTFGEYGYKLVADRSTTGENLTLPGIFLLFFLFCLFFLPGFISGSSSTFCLPWATHGKRKLLIFSVVPPCTWCWSIQLI